MRRRSAVLAAAAFVALSGRAEAAGSRSKRILDPGVLRVGTTGDRNPMTMRDPATDSDEGYDGALSTEPAADLAIEVAIVAAERKSSSGASRRTSTTSRVRPRRARPGPRWWAFPTPIATMLPQDDPVRIDSVGHGIRAKRARGVFDELALKGRLRNA